MPRPTQLLCSFCILTLFAMSTGCSLVYTNSFSDSRFLLYSDRTPEFLSLVAQETSRITDAYCESFDLPPDTVAKMTIVLKGSDTHVTDYRRVPNVLGYYIPLFNFISIDTTSLWPENRVLLRQVLLHEIAHHFTVTLYPEASSKCWLNEGLAGALEVSQFNEHQFEQPLFNPLLYYVARDAAFSSMQKPTLRDLVTKSWKDFHNDESKELNYALAWSIVYFVLEKHLPNDQPLSDRIRSLIAMDREELCALEPKWMLFLKGFDVTGHLLSRVERTTPDTRLTTRWCLEELGKARALDDLRALRELRRVFSNDDLELRFLAFEAFVTRLERARFSFLLDESWLETSLEEIKTALRDRFQPVRLRARLIETVGEVTVTGRGWTAVLVELLESDSREIRAAAATSLTRIAHKPTIANPDFWKRAPGEQRASEVAEWKQWLRHGLDV